MSRVVAVIPARGGSKRIQHKNIIELDGIPMIAHTLHAAKSSSCFDEIIVSTDCAVTKDLCESLGFPVPFLRTNFVDDFSPVALASLDAVETAERLSEQKFDVVVQLMPNCPFRCSDTIRRFMEAFENMTGSESSMISCMKYGPFNPHWAFQLRADGTGDPLISSALVKRSQDLNELYCPSGAIWACSRHWLGNQKSFYGDSTKFFDLGMIAAFDIDTHDDLEVARVIARGLWN